MFHSCSTAVPLVHGRASHHCADDIRPFSVELTFFWRASLCVVYTCYKTDMKSKSKGLLFQWNVRNVLIFLLFVCRTSSVPIDGVSDSSEDLQFFIQRKPISNCNAWWQRQVCTNNLSRVVTRSSSLSGLELATLWLDSDRPPCCSYRCGRLQIDRLNPTKTQYGPSSRRSGNVMII